jgi:hypothetical protein
LANGSHTFRAVVADRVGNVNDLSVTFVVDDAAPTVAITAPADGSQVDTATPAIQFDFSDNAGGSGIAAGTVRFSIDGTDHTAQLQVGPSSAQLTLTSPLTDGAHQVVASAGDRAGNTGTATSQFTVVAPPEGLVLFRIPSPTNTATFTVTGTRPSDSRVEISVVGSDPTIPTFTTSVEAAGDRAWAATVVASEGMNTVTAQVPNSVDGTSLTTSATVLVDTIPPTLTAKIVPEVGQFVRLPEFAVLVTYADQGSGVSVSSFSAVLDDVPIEATANSQGAFIVLKGPQSDGEHVIRVSVSDVAGNRAEKAINYTKDTQPPQMTFVGTQDDQEVCPGPLQIVAALSDNVSGPDASSCAVTLDGVSQAISANTTSILAEIAIATPGVHRVEIKVSDLAGNSRSVSQNFVAVSCPDSPPMLEVRDVRNSTFSAANRYEAPDKSGVTIDCILSQAGAVVVDAMNSSETVVSSTTTLLESSSGVTPVRFLGRDTNGVPLAAGRYTLKLSPVGTDGVTRGAAVVVGVEIYY